jgi:hypothetical protein
MAVSRVKTSSILQGFPKSRSLLAGNAAYEGLGDFNSIQTVTVGAGGTSTINFTSIPQTYSHLQIRVSALKNTFGWTTGRLNGFTTDYTYHDIRGNGSGVNAAAGSGVGYDPMYMMLNADVASPGLYPLTGIIDILDYSATNKNKTLRTLSGSDGNSTTSYLQLMSNLSFNTAAVTSISIFGGTFNQHSTISLYGIL